MVAVQPTAYRDVAVLLVPSFYRRRLQAGASILCGLWPSSNWMVWRADQVLLRGLCSSGIGLMLLGVKLVVAKCPAGASASTSFPTSGPTLKGTVFFPISVGPASMPHGRPLAGGWGSNIVNPASRELRGSPPAVMQHQLKLLPVP